MRILGFRKVYPNAASNILQEARGGSSRDDREIGLTVWRKSLVFNCAGFTVFDKKGDLVFRVDCYQIRSGNILLMDAAGNPLFTIRRKGLGFGDTWLIYEGETSDNPLFSARKHHSKPLLARVTSARQGGIPSPSYEIEGSYGNRRCSIYACYGTDYKRTKREKVAEVKHKEAVAGMSFDCDVFRLVVRPGLVGPPLAMAIVILLEQMFGISK